MGPNNSEALASVDTRRRSHHVNKRSFKGTGLPAPKNASEDPSQPNKDLRS
jgi:hypothetical protein